jgi:hypothetical protein
MSSTNRGADRFDKDYYVTPQYMIRDFFINWCNDIGSILSCRLFNSNWLDPCAGGDSVHDMSYPAVIQDIFSPPVIWTIDIREDSRAIVKADYLKCNVFPVYDVIISNPPFSLAREFIEKALLDVGDGGNVIMLLRLNYFGSIERFDFWNKQLPKYCYVHHKRTSFSPNGKTDSIEYCHMVWGKNSFPKHTLLKVI